MKKSIQHKNIFILFFLALFSGHPVMGQWENLHPGSGGQVQYIYPHPGVEGRVFYLSDMEGMYRSDDHGNTWKFQGDDFVSTQVYVMVSNPANPDTLYAGTNLGIHKSVNGGVNWQYLTAHGAPQTDIATMAVDPRNPQTLYAGVCWHEDDQFVHEHHNTGKIYRSDNGGDTWTELVFERDTIYRQVFSIAVHPGNSNELYLGADNGVYHSSDRGETWRLIPPPIQSVKGKCRGLALTPDGNYLYATYSVAVNSSLDPLNSVYYVTETDLFVTRVSDLSWEIVTTGLSDPSNNHAKTDFWRPVIDPRSSASMHKILLGRLCYGNYGLFEGAMQVDGITGQVTPEWKKIFDNQPQKGWINEFDYGWNNLLPAARHYIYTPVTWKERKIWVGSQQSAYEGTGENPKKDWTLKTSQPVKVYEAPLTSNKGKVTAYQHKGIVSTFNYDMHGDENYVVQGQGDNGILESWDGGESWTQRLFDANNYYNSIEGGADWWIDNGDAFLVLPSNPRLILAGIAPGFGGGPTNNGYLIGMRLASHTPNDQWKPLAGGDFKEGKERGDGTGVRTVAGLPRQRIYTIDFKPDSMYQVVVGTSQGIYMIDNIMKLFDTGVGQFYDIGNGLVSDHSFNQIIFDPNNPNQFFAASRPWENSDFGKPTASGNIWRVTKGNGIWNWEPIYTRGAAGNEAAMLAVWDNRGVTHLAITDNCEPRKNEVKWSTNLGETWETVLTYEQALFLPDENDSITTSSYKHQWYQPQRNNLLFGAITGFEDHLFMTFSQHQPYGKGYALIKGTLGGDGFKWIDWTGNYQYGSDGFFALPHARRSRVVQTHGKHYLYVSTMGMGLWRRLLD
jgi:hypothetical protein